MPVPPPLLAATLPAIDLVVIGAYFLATAAFAVWFGRRNADTEGYFLGGRNVPGWAVGLSLIGTSISSISFIALPAAAFALDWRLLVANYAVIIGMLVAVFVFVPLFRALPYTTAYEFLEARLGRFSRLYCALTVMLFQLLRIGTVLFLVSVTISVLLDVPIVWVIVLGGLFILLYTVFGGIEVVIWTDVVQTFVLWGGAIVIFGYIAFEMPDGLGGGLSRAWHADKFSVGSFGWNLQERTFWTLLFVGTFDAIANNCSNQTVVQRYIAASSKREAQKAVWISLLLSIPTWTFFYLVGTLLWSFYNALPDPGLAAMTPEEIVPHFTLHYLPVGVTGLIVAAIIAASMSSLDSSINAVSTIGTTDVLRRYLTPGATEKQFLLYAKLLSAAAGAAMIGIALVIATLEMESVVDLTRRIASIFGGVVGGIFLLAIFVPRVGPKALLLALPIAVGVKVWYGVVLAGWLPASWQIPVHTYWVGVVSNVTLMVVAYALSFIWPRSGSRELPVEERDADDAAAL
ncbi:SSS family solute:Na+ symporter [Phycisphaera mikurensis]|nr:SSS family solute:Na+ symporter [Phycisphaera mikurensis]